MVKWAILWYFILWGLPRSFCDVSEGVLAIRLWISSGSQCLEEDLFFVELINRLLAHLITLGDLGKSDLGYLGLPSLVLMLHSLLAATTAKPTW